jgi:DNA-binding CsgD family transcriptional regulator
LRELKPGPALASQPGEPGVRPRREAGAGGELRALAEGLIRAAAKPPPHPRQGPPAPAERPAAEGSGQVLLDLEVEGVRCVLMRRPPAAQPEVTLSPREREIARMVAKGYPNKTIASVLEISCWTVSTHLRRIFAKLAVSSRAAMVARLAELGLMG